MSQGNKLFDQMSSFENLVLSFKECSRGKKAKRGYQKYLFAYGEKLKSIEEELKATNDFKWGRYRRFDVYEPKKRIVMAAPFRDRVVHTAIHRVTFPILDHTMGARTFACRYNMGNLNAVIRLQEQLKIMGKDRYCIKLDVKKYFESIPHELLLSRFLNMLPDKSLGLILKGLLASYPDYAKLKRGIPIGNLTSQLFANFYLSTIDQLACQMLDINFEKDSNEKHAFYIRYMDDMVILANSKKKAFEVAVALVKHASEDLQLIIPPEKMMVIANDPIPFLGFVIDHSGIRTLRRNEQRFTKKLKRADKTGASESLKAQMVLSFESWRNLGNMENLV